MKPIRHRGVVNALSLLVGALFVSACAVATPATITSTKGATPTIQNVALLTEDEEAGLRRQFLSELQDSLGSRGIALESDAAFVGDFSISERSAGLGLQEIPEDSDDHASAQEPESSFKSRWYSKCTPQRVSASLVIYARSNGAVQAKSSGEFISCPGDLAELSSLANLLVDRAISN